MARQAKSLLPVLFLFLSHGLFAQKAEDVCYNPNAVKDTTKKSIKSTAFALVDGDSITIR